MQKQLGIQAGGSTGSWEAGRSQPSSVGLIQQAEYVLGSRPRSVTTRQSSTESIDKRRLASKPRSVTAWQCNIDLVGKGESSNQVEVKGNKMSRYKAASRGEVQGEARSYTGRQI